MISMARASNLTVGRTYPVKGGEYVGRNVKILNNEPVPDGEPNQRKIAVEFVGEGGLDTDVYMILPRFIDDGTVTPQEAKMAEQGIFNAPNVTVAEAVVPQPAPTVPVSEVVEEHDPITDPMDRRLDPYRPDPKIVDEYISRTLPGNKKDTDILLSYWRDRRNLMLVGDTQSGKTMAIQVVAVLAAREAGLPKPYPVFTLSGSSGVTDYDMFGQPTAYSDSVTGVERIVWLPGVVDLAVRIGGFLYIDEANMLDDRALSSLNPVADDRRFFVNRQKAVKVPGDGFIPEIVKAHPDLWVVGTYNDGYRGTGTLQEAFSNRFVHLPWDYDEDVEKRLVKSPVIRETVAPMLRNARRQGNITTPVGTRALQEMEDAAYTHGAAFAVWAISGMFPAQDRARVMNLMVERSVEELLEDELKTSGAEVS